MKSCLLTLSLLFYCTFLIAQEKEAINTPYYWLKEARNSAAAKDTTGVLYRWKMQFVQFSMTLML